MSLQVTFKHMAEWATISKGNITVKNISNSTINNWSIEFVDPNFKITDIYNMVYTDKNVLMGKSWSMNIAPGQTLSTDFMYEGPKEFQCSTRTEGVVLKGVSTPEEPEEPTKTDKLRFGYFTEWSIYQRQYNVDMIPVHNLSHVMYSFMLANPSQNDFDVLKQNYPFPPLPYRPPPTVPEGRLVHHDEWAAQQIIPKFKGLKDRNPHIKLGVSVGGWTLSWNLSNIAKNPTTRREFVKSSVDFTLNNDFDFLDIDWEYPSKKGAGQNFTHPDDPQNFVLLLKELREEFDSRSPNKHIQLTSAAGIDPVVLNAYKGAEKHLDYVLGMHYDVCGSTWAVGNHSPMYHDPDNKDVDPTWNVTASVDLLIENGFKPSQICVGCPLYGRGWSKIDPYNKDKPIFGKNVGGTPNSLSGDAGEPGLSSWRHMQSEFLKSEWTTHYDDVEKAAYAIKNTGETWSYEDPKTAVEKAKYVTEKGLGGMLFWELSDNVRGELEGNPQYDILEAINQHFEDNKDVVVDPPIDPVTPPVVTPPIEGEAKLNITITNNGDVDFVLKPGQSFSL